jgi:hypothetical protein
MKELATMPLSVRQQIERAANLARQNRPSEAKAAFEAAVIELARHDPKMCGALVGLVLGHTTITATEVATNRKVVRNAKKVLGITYSSDEVTTTDTSTVTKKIRFS